MPLCQAPQPEAAPFRREPSRRGFSLVEVMVVLTVIGVLIAMGIPSYGRAIEQARADIAAANLQAIWSAERLYWIQSHTYTADLGGLRTMGLLDPEIVLSTSGYVYSVASASDAAFTAVAARSGSTRWTGQYTIDESGLLTGAIHAPGDPDIVPGFLN